MSGLRSGTLLVFAIAVFAVGVLVFALIHLKSHRIKAGSVAVIPFLHAPSDPDLTPLCNHVSQQIENGLTQIHGVRLITGAGSLISPGKAVDPQAIGVVLKTDTVVIGKIEKERDRLIVRTDLLNAADGSQLWGAQYEYPANVTAQQIAEPILQNVRRKLTESP
jgi:TolB-like protein